MGIVSLSLNEIKKLTLPRNEKIPNIYSIRKLEEYQCSSLLVVGRSYWLGAASQKGETFMFLHNNHV